MTKDEFLSALKKEDRLHPIISIVIYYGKDAWDGPRSLKDMIVEMPDRIETVFSDYKMNLLQVRESSKYHFRNEDVQTVFQLSEYIFSRNFDGIKKEYEHRNIKAELATVIGTITESDVIMQQATENEGGYVSM